MSDDRYNGWKNYETWAVGMYLDGNKCVLDRVRETAPEGVYAVAGALEDYVRAYLPELGASIAADLLGAAVDTVDWTELATHKYNEIVEEWTMNAREEGISAAKAAATYCVDGNTTQDAIRGILKMMDDGDPVVSSYLPRYVGLSGEFADDPTAQSLAEDITNAFEIEDELVNALADAYEAGMIETFYDACEAEFRNALNHEEG
jgi:hypothetical protein